MTSVAATGSEERTRWASVGVLGGYCVLAFLYFGLRILIEPGRQYVGVPDDPQIFIWSFAWWLHALEHGSNPLVTHALWAPSGVNLSWVTTTPALAVAFAPLTALFGPVAAYNVAAVLLPALSAWSAFLLCRHVVGRLWPSAVGGYLYGFSSYELGHELGHPHLTAAFAVPLIALVVLRALEGTLGAWGLVLRLGLLLALQMYISTEVALTATVALVLGLVLSLLLAPTSRPGIKKLVAPLLGAYALTAILSLPLLYYAASNVRIAGFTPPENYTADLLNFVIPTHLQAVGGGWAHVFVRHFPGDVTEQDAFVGLPLLAIVALFARASWRTARGRFLLAALALAAYLSLGPKLIVDGHRLIPLPTLLGHQTLTLPGVGTKFLPLFDNVLPVRFALYASLAAAVIAAIWIASTRSRVLRWVLPALAVIVLIPNPAAGVWATTFSIPAFFTSSVYRTCLAPNENVLPEPIGMGGEADLWQLADAFRFRMAGGRIQTSPPSKFLHPDAIEQVSVGEPLPPRGGVALLRNYFRVEHVTSVIVDEHDLSTWAPLLDQIATPHDVGGVVLYKLSGTPAAGCPASRN